MYIQQVVRMARSGELQNLGLQEDESVVADYINLGLIELYKRFPIKTEEVVITIGESGDNYEMINDSTYRMPDNFMYLVAAYGEIDDGSDQLVDVLPINEEDNMYSINTISWDTVQIPTATIGARISLIYIASPDLISYDDSTGNWTIGSTTAADVKVPLPPQMIEALLHYVGYRGHASVNGEINSENSTHYTRFEASCARIEQLGLFTQDDMSTDVRYGIRGMV